MICKFVQVALSPRLIRLDISGPRLTKGHLVKLEVRREGRSYANLESCEAQKYLKDKKM
jgi:hypothetical protein